MTETKEKEIILEIGNCRIKEYDSLNVMVERYEEVFIPKTKETVMKWRFKGYSSTIRGALQLISINEWLIDKKAIKDFKTYLEQVQKSTAAILEVMKE
jgi:hypothetical protein